MKIIDAQGRLLGKISILDLGAAMVILIAIAAIFFSPGAPVTQGIAQSKLQPVEVGVMIRGLRVGDFDALLQEFADNQEVSIVIRNQPAGEVSILSTETLPRTTPVPQPDGTVKALPDPRPEVALIKDMIMTLSGKAQVTEDGVILEGARKIKIGTPIRLEGRTYDFNGTIIAVSTQE
ncbi:hypothetical protein Xen7305DRAFT_00027700 [Xenococcus sp. PCC 7305]|uniref:DUF4330 domain-containing protein n=1 Tax=Xenococcus sp. PCC 7305 TaxID=102125 RepID=UPI0002ACDB18|nr:DUF4330 domain-containing protein [Xenococcus sp. PCC 7305]ELS03051.1 hypothetical protein Xen7305DRAFT_00027700 [Xenococcus sp. PCC 7305]